MSFDHPTPPTPEDIRRQEEAALCAQYAELIALCEELATPPAELRESGPEIVEFEGMVLLFETTHPIEALRLITDLTSDEAPNHPIREPARIAVGLISQKLTVLRTQTDISPVRYRELEKKYQRLSLAVGVINNNKVDHELGVTAQKQVV